MSPSGSPVCAASWCSFSARPWSSRSRETASFTRVRRRFWISWVSSGGGGGHNEEGFCKYQVSSALGHEAALACMKPYGGMMSVEVFLRILGKLWVKSDHWSESALPQRHIRIHTGLRRTPPAGRSRPLVSRRICSSAKTRPPPAESPARMMFFGWTGLCFASGGGFVRYSQAARQSWIAQGNGYCGASKHK